MLARLSELAGRLEDTRTMAQKWADTLRDLVLGRTVTGPARGVRVQVLMWQATADGPQ